MKELKTYANVIKGISWKYTSSNEDAEDMQQNLYLKLVVMKKRGFLDESKYKEGQKELRKYVNAALIRTACSLLSKRRNNDERECLGDYSISKTKYKAAPESFCDYQQPYALCVKCGYKYIIPELIAAEITIDKYDVVVAGRTYVKHKIRCINEKLIKCPKCGGVDLDFRTVRSEPNSIESNVNSTCDDVIDYEDKVLNSLQAQRIYQLCFDFIEDEKIDCELKGIKYSEKYEQFVRWYLDPPQHIINAWEEKVEIYPHFKTHDHIVPGFIAKFVGISPATSSRIINKLRDYIREMLEYDNKFVH
jgi:hypothetical protein